MPGKHKKKWVVPPALIGDWMTLEEASVALSRSQVTIRHKVDCGVLEKTTYGRRTLISRASVDRYLAQFKPRGT